MVFHLTFRPSSCADVSSSVRLDGCGDSVAVWCGKSRRSQSGRAMWQAGSPHNEFSGERREKFLFSAFKMAQSILIYKHFSYPLQSLFLICHSYIIRCRKYCCETTSCTHRASLLKLKTARYLVSCIIKKQSLLHWETLRIFRISIYSIFIQKAFDQKHKRQTKLGQLWSSCSTEWMKCIQHDNTLSDSMMSIRKASSFMWFSAEASSVSQFDFLYMLKRVILLAKEKERVYECWEKKTCFIRELMTYTVQS